jgi:phosphate uptake regulator
LTFERELQRLNDDILILGSMAEKAILQSVDMLVRADLVGSQQLIPRAIDGGTPLLWVAHNLERAGDRCSNICERTIFMVTGQMAEFDMGQMKDVTIT